MPLPFTAIAPCHVSRNRLPWLADRIATARQNVPQRLLQTVPVSCRITRLDCGAAFPVLDAESAYCDVQDGDVLRITPLGRTTYEDLDLILTMVGCTKEVMQ